MPSAPVPRRLAAAVVAASLALAACAREAPLDERVRRRLDAKDYTGALDLLDRHLAGAPQDEAAKALRVRILLLAGRIEEAIQGYAVLSEATVAGNARLARHVALALVEHAFHKDDPFLQTRAAIALASVGDGDALPLFRAALSHANPSVRATALRGIQRIKSREAIALAEGALKDPDGGVRAVAAEALGAMGAEGARGPLGDALRDGEPMVRIRATIALALLGDAGARERLRRAVQPDAASLRPQPGRPPAGGAEGELLRWIKPTEREYVRIVAAEALARLQDPAGRAALLRMLEHPRTFVALFAAEAFSNLGDQAPREFLAKVMADPAEGENRLYAAWTLARLGDGSGVSAAVEKLTDRDEHVRQRAAWTLGQMGRLAPLAPLRKALADTSLLVRYQAAWALGEILMQSPASPPAKTG